MKLNLKYIIAVSVLVGMTGCDVLQMPIPPYARACSVSKTHHYQDLLGYSPLERGRNYFYLQNGNHEVGR